MKAASLVAKNRLGVLAGWSWSQVAAMIPSLTGRAARACHLESSLGRPLCLGFFLASPQTCRLCLPSVLIKPPEALQSLKLPPAILLSFVPSSRPHPLFLQQHPLLICSQNHSLLYTCRTTSALRKKQLQLPSICPLLCHQSNHLSFLQATGPPLTLLAQKCPPPGSLRSYLLTSAQPGFSSHCGGLSAPIFKHSRCNVHLLTLLSGLLALLLPALELLFLPLEGMFSSIHVASGMSS